MAYIIGVANFARNCKGQLYGVRPPCPHVALVVPHQSAFVSLCFVTRGIFLGTVALFVW